MSTNLEDAIRWAREKQRDVEDCMSNPDGRINYYTLLADAAEKHQATLPKPTWKVRVWGYAPGYDSDRPYAEYDRENAEGATIKAAHEIKIGARKVEIEAP